MGGGFIIVQNCVQISPKKISKHQFQNFKLIAGLAIGSQEFPKDKLCFF